MDKGFHFVTSDRATRIPGSDSAMFAPFVAVHHCKRNETCAFRYGARWDRTDDALPIDVVKLAVVRRPSARRRDIELLGHVFGVVV